MSGHPILAALGQLRDALGSLREANAWALNDTELTEALGQVITAERELAGVRLALTAELDRRPELTGPAASAGAWLREASRLDSGAAAGSVRLARALDRELAATKAALGEGSIGAEHARVIAASRQRRARSSQTRRAATFNGTDPP